MLLERGKTVGGLAFSFEFMGQQVDHGSLRLYVSTPVAILAAQQAELGKGLQMRRQLRRSQSATTLENVVSGRASRQD